VQVEYEVTAGTYTDTAELTVLDVGITSADIILAAGEMTQVTCDAVPDPFGSDWVSL